MRLQLAALTIAYQYMRVEERIDTGPFESSAVHHFSFEYRRLRARTRGLYRITQSLGWYVRFRLTGLASFWPAMGVRIPYTSQKTSGLKSL
jgi:hypothetical protein